SLAIDPGSPAKLFAGTNMSGVPIGAIEGSQVTWSNTGSWIDQVKINKLLVDPESASTLYAGVGGDSSISGGVYKSLDYGATWSKQSLGISSLSSSDQPAVKLADIPSSPQSSAEATDATMKSLSTLTNSIVMDLLADASAPGTLYAATSSGVYKTSDGGGLWALASAGLPAGWVNALAADPADPAVMYAATGSGVYKSADSAKSWSPTAYTGTSVLSLAFTRLSPDTLFAGTDGKGVVKSADGGVTWTRADNGLEGAVVFALAADPAHSETLYAGTGNGYDNSVFRTTDGGNSWLHVVMDLGNTDVFNLALDPKDSSVLYAGTNGRGIFRLQFQAAP
ncbi:MAG: hypothetical protein M1281_06045, partial [Chloroflexi bacterium]|nr:hypothetical protein [Chloroflexota bacterium]